MNIILSALARKRARKTTLYSNHPPARLFIDMMITDIAFYLSLDKFYLLCPFPISPTFASEKETLFTIKERIRK